MIAEADFQWEPITRWAALAGDWTFHERTARFAGRSVPHGHGLAVCNEIFQDGRLRCKVRFEGQEGALDDRSAGIVLGYSSESEGYLVIGLGGFQSAYSIWEFVPGVGWVPRKALGQIGNLHVDQDYDLDVTQRGQRLSLAVDSVPVLEHVVPSPLPGNQLGLFTMSVLPVMFRDYEMRRRAPIAFVAMQFGEPYDTIYRTLIRPKTQALGFEVSRIDDVKRPGIIFQDIQQKIIDAKVLIAEITAPNQNVFYEIGYAHALNKPTILLAQRGRDLPFDIRSYRVIFYDDSIGGKPLVDKALREHLQSILQET
jgi:hypothetical protein